MASTWRPPGFVLPFETVQERLTNLDQFGADQDEIFCSTVIAVVLVADGDLDNVVAPVIVDDVEDGWVHTAARTLIFSTELKSETAAYEISEDKIIDEWESNGFVYNALQDLFKEHLQDLEKEEDRQTLARALTSTPSFIKTRKCQKEWPIKDSMYKLSVVTRFWVGYAHVPEALVEKMKLRVPNGDELRVKLDTMDMVDYLRFLPSALDPTLLALLNELELVARRSAQDQQEIQLRGCEMVDEAIQLQIDERAREQGTTAADELVMEIPHADEAAAPPLITKKDGVEFFDMMSTMSEDDYPKSGQRPRSPVMVAVILQTPKIGDDVQLLVRLCNN